MKNFKSLDKKLVHEVEKDILTSWESINKILNRQIDNRENNDNFVFYDGPTFANPIPLKRYIV